MSRSLPPTELVAQAVAGDPRALDALFEQCLPVVLSWCKRLGGPRVDPEDATHDVMVVVLDRIDGLERPEAFGSWLFTTTRRVLSTHRKRAWIRRWLPGKDPDEHAARDAGLEGRDLARRLQAVLDELPLAQREVLILHDLDGHSDQAVADLLGVPKGTVKSRLRLGRRKLRDLAEARGLWPPALQLVKEAR